MHKPYQCVHIFSPKSEMYECFFLLFVCSNGFLLHFCVLFLRKYEYDGGIFTGGDVF